MEHPKISNLLNDADDSKFVARKWNIVNDNSNSIYAAANEITYNTDILKFNLCNYNDAHILVIGDITVVAAPATQVAFKNCAPFTKYIIKNDGTTIADAEDLDLVIPMCNLIEYSSNYFETTGTLQFYAKDEANFNADIVNDSNFKSFKYKATLFGNTVTEADNTASGTLLNAKITKRLSKEFESSFY